MVMDDPQCAVSHSIIPNLRHHEALEKCYHNVQRSTNGLQGQTPPELIAIDIREALDWLDVILGTRVDQEILDSIFSRFCIGK